MTSPRLEGRRVLIVGGGTGIGRATALLCAREGARVAVLGRRRDPLEEVAAATGALPCVADARNSKDVRRALAEIDDRMGGLDGLVNAAGVLNTTRVDDLDDATWDAVLESNLTATFLVCREALPYLRRSPNAAIANVAALAAVLPGVASVAYSAAKAGVIQLSKVLAAQLAPGIRVNSVCPGAVDTAMTRGFLDDKSPEQREAFIARYASKRLATPDELANLLCFLISNEASCITGSNFVADGGRAYR